MDKITTLGATITAKQLAQRLQVSIGWVYRHKRILGGVQFAPNEHVLFFDNRIKELLDAVQGKIGEIPRYKDDSRQAENPNVRQAERREGMGIKPKRRKMASRDSTADPFNLLA